MKPIIISLILLFASQITYGQNNPLNSKELEKENYLDKLQQQTFTMKIDLNSYSRENIGNFNHEMNQHPQKITFANYDDVNKVMIITHNSLMSKDDMYQIIAKYNISKTNIISYQ